MVLDTCGVNSQEEGESDQHLTRFSYWATAFAFG